MDKMVQAYTMYGSNHIKNYSTCFEATGLYMIIWTDDDGWLRWNIQTDSTDSLVAAGSILLKFSERLQRPPLSKPWLCPTCGEDCRGTCIPG
jgi:hypothetical protein